MMIVNPSLSHYHTRFIPVAELDIGLRRAMAALYLRHYDACSEGRFYTDLDAKSEVLLLYCADQLIGFSTFLLYPFVWHGQRLRIVFSGDTVVDREHWGQQALAFGWIARMGRLYRDAPEQPLYWFLIVKGHRTYRYLPAFSLRFFPDWRCCDTDLQALAEALGRDYFGNDYSAAQGVVTFAESHGQLKADIAEPDAAELQKEGVRFFLQRNPGYRDGHELVCVCPLAAENLKPLSRRLFLQGDIV